MYPKWSSGAEPALAIPSGAVSEPLPTIQTHAAGRLLRGAPAGNFLREVFLWLSQYSQHTPQGGFC